jgi:hypothetical protein
MYIGLAEFGAKHEIAGFESQNRDPDSRAGFETNDRGAIVHIGVPRAGRVLIGTRR